MKYLISDPIEIQVSGSDLYNYKLYALPNTTTAIYQGKVYPYPTVASTTKVSYIVLNDVIESYLKDETDIDKAELSYKVDTSLEKSFRLVINDTTTIDFDVINCYTQREDIDEFNNLIRNGLFNNGTTYWNVNGAGTTISSILDGTINRLRVDITAGLAKGVFTGSDYLKYKIGEQYTISFWHYLNGNTLTYGLEESFTTTVTGNTWGYTEYTFTALNDWNNFIFYVSPGTDTHFFLSQVTLTKGTNSIYTLNQYDKIIPEFLRFNSKYKTANITNEYIYFDFYTPSNISSNAVVLNFGSTTRVVQNSVLAGYNRVLINTSDFYYNGTQYYSATINNPVTNEIAMIINLSNNCPIYRIYYVNSRGGIDSINCNKASKYNEQNTQFNYTKNYRSFNGTSLVGDISTHSNTTDAVTIKGIYIMQTDLLNDKEHKQLKDLYSSPKIWVYEIENDKYYAVNITDTNYDEKKFKTDKLVNRQITLERSQINRRR